MNSDFSGFELAELCFYSQFSHPNIPKWHAIKSKSDTIELILDNCDITLDGWVRRVPYKERVSALPTIIFQIASVLNFFYRNKIIHADLKPDNIMINYLEGDIKVYVIDFGSICFDQRCRKEVETTYVFCSPEMFEVETGNNKDLLNSDIFSLGLIVSFICCKNVEEEDELRSFSGRKERGLFYPVDLGLLTVAFTIRKLREIKIFLFKEIY